MRILNFPIFVQLLGLVLLSTAQLGVHAGPAPPNGDDTSSTTNADASIMADSSSTGPITTFPVTQTTTLFYVPLSILTSSSEPSQTSTTATSTPTTNVVMGGSSGSTAISNSDASSTSMPASSLSDAQSNSISHRNLIIILSAVLGFIGLVLITSALILACRYRSGKSPFIRRGVSPIDDEEIASWRGTITEHKPQASYSSRDPIVHHAKVFGPAQTPEWMWAPSPSLPQPIISPFEPMTPDTPPFLAKAPNARAGLTDEAVPGAEPFIAPMKRQSSRLAKRPPPGHGRTKSRRSSMSGRSMWSREPSLDFKQKEAGPTWFDPEDENIGRELRNFDGNNSSPSASVFDELSAGGLSPRPKSRLRMWESGKQTDHSRTLL